MNQNVFSEIFESLVEGSKTAVTDDLANLCLMTAQKVLPESVTSVMLSSPTSASLLKAAGAAVLILATNSPAGARLGPAIRNNIHTSCHRILLAQGLDLTRDFTASIDPILDHASSLFSGQVVSSYEEEEDESQDDAPFEATKKQVKKPARNTRTKTNNTTIA